MLSANLFASTPDLLVSPAFCKVLLFMLRGRLTNHGRRILPLAGCYLDPHLCPHPCLCPSLEGARMGLLPLLVLLLPMLLMLSWAMQCLVLTPTQRIVHLLAWPA